MQASRLSQNYFYLLLLFALYVAYRLFSPYLDVIVFAFVATAVFRPVFLFLVGRLQRREGLAVLLTIVTILVLVMLPLGVILKMTVAQVVQFSQDIASLAGDETPVLRTVVDGFNAFMEDVPLLRQVTPILTEGQIVATAQEWATAVGGLLARSVVNLGASSVDWITKAIVFLSLLAAMFPGWPEVIELLRQLSPLEDRLDQQYVDRIVLMTQAMVKGTFVLIALQGAAMAVLLWVVGVPYVFFWGLIASFVAILPGGCGLVALPIAVYLLLIGSVWQGIVLLLGYLLVVANIDPLIRPRLVPKEAQFNPVLVLLSLAGGVKLFGFMGVIYGPIVLVFLVTTVEIYLKHYRPSSAPAGP